jgi:hypothetical protein
MKPHGVEHLQSEHHNPTVAARGEIELFHNRRTTTTVDISTSNFSP